MTIYYAEFETKSGVELPNDGHWKFEAYHDQDALNRANERLALLSRLRKFEGVFLQIVYSEKDDGSLRTVWECK